MSSQTTSLPTQLPRRRRWPKFVGFVGAGFLLLIIAAAMIPCFIRSDSAMGESMVVTSLRAIAGAQTRFSQEHPSKGYATSLAEFGSETGGYQIDSTLASGVKGGYVFKMTPGIPNAAGRITSFTATATPQKLGANGVRSFFVDESGVIRSTHENRPATASDPALQ